MCRTRRLVLPVLAVLLLHFQAEEEQGKGVTDSCDGSADIDVLAGYTSLLQSDISLHRHALGRQSTRDKVEHKRDGHRKRTLDHQRDRRPHGHSSSSAVSSNVWILSASVMFIILCYVFVVRPALGQAPTGVNALPFVQHESEEEEHVRIHDHLGEDTYSLAIALLVRDLHSFALGEKRPGLKLTRITYALGLIVLTIGLQIGIVICTKQFVTPNQVADIRDAYDKFEEVMYMNHTYLNANGKQRGITRFFNASMFESLSDEDKQAACQIPFSQLKFLEVILLVWSITCMANLKNCIETFLSLIVQSVTLDSMKDSLLPWQQAAEVEDDPSEDSKDKSDGKPSVMVITGLTPLVKAFLALNVFIPEFLTTCYILWLGCRWLAATNDFGNVVSNAVALEFVLQLKYLLFQALASPRNKRELLYTGISPPWRKESAGYFIYFNTLIWFALAVFWVWFYVFHFQKVLPDYKWDVHQVCDDYLANLLTASGGDD